MSYATKYRIARIVSMLALLVMLYCLSRAIPAGMSGNIQTAKPLIGAALLVASAGIAASLAAYYCRAKAEGIDTGNDAVSALGAVGAKPTLRINQTQTTATDKKSPGKRV